MHQIIKSINANSDRITGIKKVPYFCSFYNKDCSYNKCPCYSTVRERTEYEMASLNGSDIPFIGRFVDGNFCSRFGDVSCQNVIVYA